MVSGGVTNVQLASFICGLASEMAPTEAGQKCTWCIPLASVPPRDVGRRSGPEHAVRNDAMLGEIQPSQILMTLGVTEGTIDALMGRPPGSGRPWKGTVAVVMCHLLWGPSRCLLHWR